MINKKILQIAKTRIDLEISEQDKQLDAVIEGIKRMMASKGMSGSGNLIIAIQNECVKAVNRRAEIVLEFLCKSTQSAGLV